MNPGVLMLVFPLVCAMLAGCERTRVLGPPKAVPVREDGALELRLMSFNVRYETQEDRGTRSWRRRVVGAVRMIAAEKPDVIGVQEALHGQAADLWASLPDFELVGVGRDDGKQAGEYSAIFFRRDRFRLDPADQGTFWLSDTPDTPGSRTWGNEITRLVTWIRLLDLATGRGFYVYNTHWDHQSQPSRERSALLMARRIDGRPHAGDPVVLIGDLNVVEANPAYRYLTGEKVSLAGKHQQWANGLVDTYQQLYPARQDRRSLHFFTGNRDGSLKVDHVMVSRGVHILEVAIVWEDKPLISDHFPVTARVVFPK
ncbi:MAG: endonuclease/exonuclease/phosphatase family protein [Akkermansiaceae bacterium]